MKKKGRFIQQRAWLSLANSKRNTTEFMKNWDRSRGAPRCTPWKEEGYSLESLKGEKKGGKGRRGVYKRLQLSP